MTSRPHGPDRGTPPADGPGFGTRIRHALAAGLAFLRRSLSGLLRPRDWRACGLWIVVLAVIATLVAAARYGASPWLAATGAGLLSAGAPFAVGSLLGFLFGMPRTLTAAESAASGRRLRVNTNIEEISDWLTKILVGLGLTELRQAPGALARMGATVAPVFGGDGRGEAIAQSVLVFFLVAGFLVAYLAMRLRVSEQIGAADDRLNPRVVERVASMQISVADDRAGSDAAQSVPDADVNEILRQPLAALDGVDELRAWGKAQILRKQYAQGAEALGRAVALAPEDADLRRDYGTALHLAKRWPEARAQFDLALGASRSPEERRTAVESVVFTSLYQDPPMGFTKAIHTAERYLSSLPERRGSAILHAWLACAYGQKHAWAQSGGEGGEPASPDAIQRARDAAIRHVRIAIELDPMMKSLLQSALPPNGPDDDLSSLRADLDTPELLGPLPPG